MGLLSKQWGKPQRDHLNSPSPPSLDGIRKRSFKGQKLSFSTVSNTALSLATGKKLFTDPEDIYFHPALLERLRNFTPLCPITFIAPLWLIDWLEF